MECHNSNIHAGDVVPADAYSCTKIKLITSAAKGKKATKHLQICGFRFELRMACIRNIRVGDMVSADRTPPVVVRNVKFITTAFTGKNSREHSQLCGFSFELLRRSYVLPVCR